MKWLVNPRLGALIAASALVISFSWVHAQQGGGAAVAVDADDIGGVVTSAKGPEAGVWVIAETTDLPAKFAKMVVTDDQGRYVLPDLPPASYPRRSPTGPSALPQARIPTRRRAPLASSAAS